MTIVARILVRVWLLDTTFSKLHKEGLGATNFTAGKYTSCCGLILTLRCCAGFTNSLRDSFPEYLRGLLFGRTSEA